VRRPAKSASVSVRENDGDVMSDISEAAASKPPVQHYFEHGALSYVQIPAADVKVSARFYEALFGWTIRGGSPDHYSFTDGAGRVIGAWVTGRAIAASPGVLLYV
jgi:hypothetical protein